MRKLLGEFVYIYDVYVRGVLSVLVLYLLPDLNDTAERWTTNPVQLDACGRSSLGCVGRNGQYGRYYDTSCM